MNILRCIKFIRNCKFSVVLSMLMFYINKTDLCYMMLIHGALFNYFYFKLII